MFSALVLVVFFGGLELGCRVFWTPPTGGLRPAMGERQFLTWLSDQAVTDALSGPLYREDRHFLWTLVPGADIKSEISHRHSQGEVQFAHVTINQDGYRGRRLDTQADAAENSLRVLCLGDSNFFGYPLDDKHAFPFVLEQALMQLNKVPGRKIQVVNGGVPGYTIAQGRRLFDKKFQQHDFDVVLLSFLNNDAWRQPQTDARLFDQRSSFLYPVGQAARHWRLYEFLNAMLVEDVAQEEFTPRLPLAEFLSHYTSLVAHLHQAGARVMIVDHCAYPQYQDYSSGLQELVARDGVDYLRVASEVKNQLDKPNGVAPYRELADRVQRRWGLPALRDRPYLWYYAEYTTPEHLNEVGTAWLADQIAPSLLGQPK